MTDRTLDPFTQKVLWNLLGNLNDLHDEIAQLRGTRKVLWNLLGECLPVIDALMQLPGDDDSDAHLNSLAGRINDARTAGSNTMSQNTTAMQAAKQQEQLI